MMAVGWIIVLDIGKSFSKASLWDEAGICIAQRTRANPRLKLANRMTLDFLGIERWLREILAEFAKMGRVSAIVPVAHGAAMALVSKGQLLEEPLDYEWSGVATQRAAYDLQRDPFIATGSPALPAGLNLGIQLHWLESIGSAGSGKIVPWPQYWAWLLSGVPSAEVTSLGCHTDLWRPYERGPSELAVRRGWAERLAPVTSAGAVLGTLRSGWIDATGLSRDVEVYCGIHDSNAALLNARSHPDLKDRDATILSTGTWFVAMRTPVSKPDPASIAVPEARDCLLNVDTAGTPIPSARFMGGREIELLAGTDAPLHHDAGEAAAIKAVESGDMFLPSYTPGIGPYPNAPAREVSPISARDAAMVKALLYAALLADASLDLIGSCDTVVVDGRFSRAPIFVQALANLRPTTRILVSSDEQGVAHGALLLAKQRRHEPPLKVISPLQVDMSAYRARWREAAEHAR
jgi:sugar (pentulose or hexulose) kinase